MRVLLLPHRYPPLGRGGVETWAWTLARGLRELGAHPVVATRDDRGGADPFSVREEREDGTPVFWIRHRHEDARTWRDTWADPRMERALRSIVRATRPDILHLGHPDGFGVAPARVARDLGVPLVVTLHDPKWFCGRGQMVAPGGGICVAASEERCARCLAGQLGRGPARGLAAKLATTAMRRRAEATDAERPLEARPPASAAARRRWRVRQAALRAVLQGADVLISPSRHLASVAATHGVDRPIEIVSNGLGGRPPPPGAWPGGPLRLGWFGVPGPRKGLDVLLEALAACPPGTATLQVHGADLGSVARAAGGTLPAGVTAHGPYPPEEAVARMTDVHVVVLPSTWPENQPMVALEARLAGRPLLATRVGGLPELVSHGTDGWLVPPSDVAALSALVSRLASAPADVREASRQTRAPPTRAAFAHAHACLYRDALGGTVPLFDQDTARAPQ
jgi:glycosyltransferase involved in cell wall biosynthesis